MYILIQHAYIEYELDQTKTLAVSASKDKLIAHASKLEGTTITFEPYSDGSGNLIATLNKPELDHYCYAIEAIEVL